MSNNIPGTCVCVGIAPQFFQDLCRSLLIFINMQIRRFFYRSMTLQNLLNCINDAIKITTMVILVLFNLRFDFEWVCRHFLRFYQ